MNLDEIKHNQPKHIDRDDEDFLLQWTQAETMKNACYCRFCNHPTIMEQLGWYCHSCKKYP